MPYRNTRQDFKAAGKGKQKNERGKHQHAHRNHARGLSHPAGPTFGARFLHDDEGVNTERIVFDRQSAICGAIEL